MKTRGVVISIVISIASAAALGQSVAERIDAIAPAETRADAPAKRWIKLATDASVLERVVALDELARSSVLDARAGSLVRILSEADPDERVRTKAAMLSERLVDRISVHVRPRADGEAAASVRVGWRQYPADQLDVMVSAVARASAAGDATEAMAHGMRPGSEPRAALVLAGGATPWSQVEPALVALAKLRVQHVSAVSTTAGGWFTADRSNLRLAALGSEAAAPQPMKIVLERTAEGKLRIRVVGLSDPREGFDELRTLLTQLRTGDTNPAGMFAAADPIVIDVGEGVAWSQVVAALNAAAESGYVNVMVAAVRAERIVEPAGPPAADPSATPASSGVSAPAPAGAGEGGVTLFGQDIGEGDSIVYVLDGSGSANVTVDAVVEAVRRSMSQLGAHRRFTVVLCVDGAVVESPPRGWKLATAENTQRIGRWLDPASGLFVPQGLSDPTRAIEAALAYRPQRIVLVTAPLAKSGPKAVDSEALFTSLAGANRDGATRISVVQLGGGADDAVLRRIAATHKGRFVRVAVD